MDDLLTEENPVGVSAKSAVLWPLPGGQDKFLDSLLRFLDEIGAQKPTLDVMTTWVMRHFEKVTKQKVVESYIRAVLKPLGLIEFDGDRIVLTADGEVFRSKRDPAILLDLLKRNIAGVVELLDLLASGPTTTDQAHQHLIKTIGVTWETDAQVKFRLQWLTATGYVGREGKNWRLLRHNR